MIRIGIVGLGRMGLSHLSIVRPHPNVDVVGICDTSRFVLDVMRRYTGLRAFRDHRDLIESTAPDALVIATPSESHADICAYALERGIGTFLEKPLALTLESSGMLVGLAEQAAVTAQVGYHLRFVPSFEEVRRWLDLGLVGDVHHLRVSTHGPAVLRSRGKTWRARRSEGGGCLYDYASHAVNLATYYLGMPSHVAGAAMRSVFSEDADDEVYTTLHYTTGATGQLSANWSDASERKMSVRLEIWGKAGKIVADRQECGLYLREKPGAETDFHAGWNVRHMSDLTAPVRYYVRGEEYTHQLDHFIESVEARRTESRNNFAAAHETDVVLEMIRLDAESGGRTPVPPAAAAQETQGTEGHPS
jgi:scyllo-inositol 2-dehydrogenase (NADP+)